MQNTPRQTKLLGATVRGLGLVVAVSSTLPFCYAVVESADKSTQLVRIATLSRDEVMFRGGSMSHETVDRERHKRAHHAITVEVDMMEPVFVPAAFDLLRQHAKAHGMSDVRRIHIHLTVEFDGQTTLVEVDEMENRLENLWFGQVTKHEATSMREMDEPKQTVRYK